MSNFILNNLSVSNDNFEQENIAKNLKQEINNLKGSFYDLETGKVNYLAMKDSEVFREYQKISALLKHFDLNSLNKIEAKLAFWINIYNCLVVDAIIQLNVKDSVLEVKNFFESASYNIGGMLFSLDDIEHGVLRGNVKKHFFAKRPFYSEDPRKKFIIETLDPRIHFCLVCGSKSCPPIGTYQEERIFQQMDLSASNFINGGDIKIDKEKNHLIVSKIFKWYKNDFGTKKDLINFLAKYLKKEDDKSFILDNLPKISIYYLDYDWNLNH